MILMARKIIKAHIAAVGFFLDGNLLFGKYFLKRKTQNLTSYSE